MQSAFGSGGTTDTWVLAGRMKSEKSQNKVVNADKY
jgi:hypothetical protein